MKHIQQFFNTSAAMVLLMMFVTTGMAQTVSSKYMISFADKEHNTYNVNNPSAFLGPRAIERRTKFSIPVTTQDLPVSQVYLDSLTNRGAKVIAASKWFNAALIDTDDSAFAMSMLTLPFVTAVDLLYYVVSPRKGSSGKSGTMMMNDKFSEGLDGAPGISSPMPPVPASGINYGFSFAQANIIGATYLHQLGFTGDSIVIGILDAGFSGADVLPVFDSLHMNNRILSTRNFVNPGDSVYKNSNHGMMVLSTMGGNLPGIMVGTAPNASYHLLLTEDVATEFPVEEFYYGLGAEYADSIGVDVINSSLTYTTFDLSILDHTYADCDGKTNLSAKAATYAASKGMILVTSAGNGGGSSWFYICSPGDADSVLTVGAVDVNGQYAPFTSTGPTFDQRVKPDVASVGWNATIASSIGGSTTGNGTSFSSPIMCGAVACLWQAYPNLSNFQIMDAVRRSAHQYTFPDTLLGYGIPNLAIAHLVLGGQDFPNISKEKKFTVAPNPFNNMFVITFYATDTQHVTLELYDMRGKLLHSREADKHQGMNVITLTDLDNMAAGAYVLKMRDGDNVITQKVIRN